MKKILVTGGSGFIGSNLIKFLIKKKYHVINIDKLTYSANFYNLKDISKNKNYSFIKSNISNKKKISKILFKHKPFAIFNLAAETHVDRSIDNPENFIKTNILAVYNFLNVVRNYIKKSKKKIKFIHISTDEVYGDVIKGRSTENSSYKPNSPYSASKASADHIINSFIKTYNFPAIISNCCNNYGPNQFPEKLIPKIIVSIINNKPLIVYGKGENSREWIYVKDHCEALYKILKNGKIGETYNVGTGQNLKNIILIKKLLKIVKLNLLNLGKNVKIKFVKDRPGHDFRYALNSKKISNKLKWKAKININFGLIKTVNWYLNNKSYFTSIPKKFINKRLGLKND